MRTPGQILVQTAFSLYHDNPERLQEYLAKRFDNYITNHGVDIGQTNFESIVIFVCDTFGANANTIASKYRGTAQREARMTLYHICVDLMKWTLTKTAVKFQRYHSTVINGMQQLSRWVSTDKTFARKVSICVDYAVRTLNSEDYEKDNHQDHSNLAV